MSTENKPASATNPLSIVAEMQQSCEKLFVAAELILQKMAAVPDAAGYGVGHIDPNDAMVLRLAGIDISTRVALDRAVGRVRTELELRKVYTGAEALEAARVELAEARAAEKARRDEVNQQIEELKQSLVGLEERLHKAVQVHDPMQTAFERLASHAPPFIVQRANKAALDCQETVQVETARTLERELYALQELARLHEEHANDPNIESRALSFAEQNRIVEIERLLPTVATRSKAVLREARDVLSAWVEHGLASVAVE